MTMDVMINTRTSNPIDWSWRSIFIDHAALVLVSGVGVTEALLLPLLLLGMGESVLDDMDDTLLANVVLFIIIAISISIFLLHFLLLLLTRWHRVVSNKSSWASFVFLSRCLQGKYPSMTPWLSATKTKEDDFSTSLYSKHAISSNDAYLAQASILCVVMRCAVSIMCTYVIWFSLTILLTCAKIIVLVLFTLIKAKWAKIETS